MTNVVKRHQGRDRGYKLKDKANRFWCLTVQGKAKRDKLLLGDLIAPSVKTSGKGMVIESKESIRKRLGRSKDAK